MKVESLDTILALTLKAINIEIAIDFIVWYYFKENFEVILIYTSAIHFTLWTWGKIHG